MDKILQPMKPPKASQPHCTKSHPRKQKATLSAGHHEHWKSSSDDEAPSNESNNDEEKAKMKLQMEKERKARNQRQYYQK
jgi:hypothetical protein